MPYREPLGAKTLREIDRGIQQMRWSMQNYAARAEQHMKSHAPWQDRTRRARESLRARTEEIPLPGGGVRMVLTLSYGDPGQVPYDEFLETMQSGNFAILGPTADLFGPRIQRRMRELARGSALSVGTGTEERF